MSLRFMKQHHFGDYVVVETFLLWASRDCQFKTSYLLDYLNQMLYLISCLFKCLFLEKVGQV